MYCPIVIVCLIAPYDHIQMPTLRPTPGKVVCTPSLHLCITSKSRKCWWRKETKLWKSCAQVVQKPCVWDGASKGGFKTQRLQKWASVGEHAASEWFNGVVIVILKSKTLLVLRRFHFCFLPLQCKHYTALMVWVTSIEDCGRWSQASPRNQELLRETHKTHRCTSLFSSLAISFNPSNELDSQSTKE